MILGTVLVFVEKLLMYYIEERGSIKLLAVMLKHPKARQILCRKMSEQMKIHSTIMSAICFLSYEYSFLSEDLKILLPS